MIKLPAGSLSLLGEIIENIPARVFWKDRECRYLGCNSAFALDAGLTSAAEIVGKDDFQLAWKAQAERYRADDQQIMASGLPKLNYEEPQTTPDGRQFWLRTSKVPLLDDNGNISGILGIYEDITARKLAELEAGNANRALRAISACNELIFRADNEQELLQSFCALIVQAGGYRMSWIGYARQDADSLIEPMARYGHDEGYIDGGRFSWSGELPSGQGLSGMAIRSGRTEINQNYMDSPHLAPWREAALQRGYRASIALPLKSQGSAPMGVLMIYAEEENAFTSEEVRLLEDLASDLVFGIESLRTRAEREKNRFDLQQSLDDFTKAMSSTMEMRDPYTAGHQRRTAALAVAIARELQLPEDRIHGLELASTIHDIGQVKIPTEILTRPGRLNDVEMMIVREHSQNGYEILRNIRFPWPIADIIRQHHERLDGSGYPQGLKGDDILLEARILAVADVTEAMHSHRPYRPAWSQQEVLAELERGRGRLYDPAAVDACLKLFRDRQFVFPA